LKPNYSPLKIPKVKIIGLTGNIASGKSAVGEMFKMLGATVIDADQAARSIVEPEKPAWKDIVDTFGSGALNPDGTIDREKLGEIVFNDEAKRKVLNDITHPRILEELSERIERNRLEGKNAVIIEAALIVEKGGWLKEIIDALIVVSSDRESRIERLGSRSGYTREEALSRINSQMPSAQKEKHADFVIDNSGSLEDTQHQVLKVWENIINTV